MLHIYLYHSTTKKVLYLIFTEKETNRKVK